MPIKKLIMGLGSLTLFTNVNALHLPSAQSFRVIKENSLSHPNLLEEGYFNNEMRKFFIEYQGFNGKLKEESHSLKIADVNNCFLKTIKEIEISDEFVYGNILIKNLTNKPMKTPEMTITNIDLSQTVSLDSKNIAKVDESLLVNYDGKFLSINPSQPFNEEIRNITSFLTIKPEVLDPNCCMISETKVRKIVNYKQSLLYIPLDNDAICKTIIDNRGHRYTVTPRNLVEAIANDSKSLNYYLGINEFLQYKDFINKQNSPYLVWMAIKLDDFKVQLEDFAMSSEWNYDMKY